MLGRAHPSPPIAPEPVEIDDTKPETLLSAPVASKTNFHTHITETSSFYGFKGGGRSSTSFASTVGSNPRSEGGSEREGPLSLASASSRRSSGFSGSGGVGGEKLSEQSDEEAFEEEDFEDDDERPTAGPGRINDIAGRRVAAAGAGPAGLGDVERQGQGLTPLQAELSPSRKHADDVGAGVGAGAPSSPARSVRRLPHIIPLGVILSASWPSVLVRVRTESSVGRGRKEQFVVDLGFSLSFFKHTHQLLCSS